MTDETNSRPAGDGETGAGEVSTYTRVTPLVTVREGQGAGGRAGDRGERGTRSGVPRAGATRDARARGRSVAQGWMVALRHHLGEAVWSGGEHSPEQAWAYITGQEWMRDSDNTARKWTGYVLGVVLLMPLAIAGGLMQMLAFRFRSAIPAAAILAALWVFWPHAAEQPPPPAPPVAVDARGAR